jgi:hypothetical protein
MWDPLEHGHRREEKLNRYSRFVNGDAALPLKGEGIS